MLPPLFSHSVTTVPSVRVFSFWLFDYYFRPRTRYCPPNNVQLR